MRITALLDCCSCFPTSQGQTQEKFSDFLRVAQLKRKWLGFLMHILKFVSLMTYWLPPVIWTATIFQHWSSYNCIRRTIRLFLQSQSRKEFLQLDMKESTVKVNIINIYGGIFWYKLKFFNVVKFIKEKTPATDWEGLTVPHNHQRKYIQHLRRIPRSIGKNTQNIQ